MGGMLTMKKLLHFALAIALGVALGTGIEQVYSAVTTTTAANPTVYATSVTGFMTPAQGGTGVANNNASTLTVSGAFGTTLTVTGTTAVTLPTSGTLTTTAGTTGTSMVLIATATAANSATIDFTSGITSTYDQYVVLISGLQPVTTTTQLQMLGSSDNGGTWKTGAGSYVWEYGTQSGGGAITATGGSATFIALTPATVAASGSTGSLRATIEISAPSDTANYKHINFRTSFYETSIPSLGRTDGAAFYGFTTALNGIRFQMSSGNISVGKFALYGIRNL